MICTPPPPIPHIFAHSSYFSSMSTPAAASSGRKRKADDEDLRPDDRMSASPTIHSQTLPAQRPVKKPRSGLVGRPLALPRLLETLDADSLRAVLANICASHPQIGSEVVKAAPRPSVSSALGVLKKYEATLQEAFPFGGNSSSDYAYLRVKGTLFALLEALQDFTPQYLPGHEPQVTESLSFLDGATEIIHRLPDWESFQYSLHKQNAYEEIARAWTLVLKEAAKRAGGIQLQYGGWDQKLAKHNQQSDGKLQEAIDELGNILGWMGGQQHTAHVSARNSDISSVRQELLSGTYGSNLSVRVGPW